MLCLHIRRYLFLSSASLFSKYLRSIRHIESRKGHRSYSVDRIKQSNMTNILRTFASDNYAGVLPEIMSALVNESQSKSHARAYGNDDVTQAARLAIKQQFTSVSDDSTPGVFFVFNGTGANVLSILACTHSYHAVVCADISHIITDESSSPETVTGVRLISIPTNENGKIMMDRIEEKLDCLGDMHAAQPRMISIAQPTEYGTVYTLDELKQISSLAKKYNLYFRKIFPIMKMNTNDYRF